MRFVLAAAVAGAAVLAGGCGGDATRPPPSGVPDAMYALSGVRQQGPAGETLPQALEIQVTDADGRPAAGAVVTFAPRDSTHGAVTPAQATSDAQGRVRATWRLGRGAGADTVTATSALRGGPILFTATATPNGVITGTVTLDPAAPFASRVPPAPGESPLPALPMEAGGAGDALLADDSASLIVTFRPESVGARGAGAQAMRSRATAAAVAGGMRRRLEGHARLRMQVRDLSPAVLAARVRVPRGRMDEARAALAADPSVARVQAEGRVHGAAMRTPDDLFWPAQAWNHGMADLPRAWPLATGSASVLVAVVDDGTRFDHPDLAPNLTRDGYDFASQAGARLCAGGTAELAGDGDGYDADPTIPVAYRRSGACLVPAPVAGHGLHVAGIIGAVGDNGVGMVGVAWTVRIRPVRVLNAANTGSWFDVAQGILYAAGLPASDGRGGTVQAAEGARIINLSLGGAEDAQVLRDAVAAARGTGALLVAAAMNAATAVPYYPAAYPEVVSVAAVGPLGTPAAYSNFGPMVDIAAPGGDRPAGAGSTWMVGSTVWSFGTGEPGYAYMMGTSMAAPHVSGVAALLLAREPGLTAEQLRARLLDYATDAGAPGRDDMYGAGILNARNSLTRTLAPARAVLVRLYDARTGALVRQLRPEGASYAFRGLADGSYWVFAGEDEEGDGMIGLPDRRWGAFGGAGAPSAVWVAGAFTHAASFAIGAPREAEENGAAGMANALLAGGWYDAELVDAGDADYYRVTLPAGRYTFATEGRGGACRYTLGADTELSLLGAAGAVLAANDDADVARRNHCSRITQTLAAGTYYVAVRTASAWPGRYALTVRPAE